MGYSSKEGEQLPFRSFLLAEEPLTPIWLERAFIEVDRSLVLGPDAAGNGGDGTIVLTGCACPLDISFCSKMESTISTSGTGPANLSKE